MVYIWAKSHPESHLLVISDMEGFGTSKVWHKFLIPAKFLQQGYEATIILWRKIFTNDSFRRKLSPVCLICPHENLSFSLNGDRLWRNCQTCRCIVHIIRKLDSPLVSILSQYKEASPSKGPLENLSFSFSRKTPTWTLLGCYTRVWFNWIVWDKDV